MTLVALRQDDQPPLLIAEVAERLACSPRRVLQLIADGQLRAIQLGTTARTMRIERAELEAFIARGGVSEERDP